MTYEAFCADIKSVRANVEHYNEWRETTLNALLTDIGPRIAKVNSQFHCGCGFGYQRLLDFGTLVHHLAFPWQVSANHCDKYEDDVCAHIAQEVSFELMMESLAMAERCIAARAAGQQCKCQEEIEAKRMKRSKRDTED